MKWYKQNIRFVLSFASISRSDLDQGSSLGSYSLDWFDMFYQFCNSRTAQALVGRSKSVSWPPIKVLFPSLATVDASILGRDVAHSHSCMICRSSMFRGEVPCFVERR